MSRAGQNKPRDEVGERLRQRRRSQTAPPGYYTKSMLKEKAGLTEAQIRSILWHKIILSDGTTSENYALYSERSVEKLMNMKADGSLFRRLRDLKAGSVEDGSTIVANYSEVQGVQVFELLSAGKSLEEIILTLRMHPLVVKRIREDYDEITGSIHLPRRVVEQLNAFGAQGLPGTFPLGDANDVLDVFQGYTVVRACPNCPDRLTSPFCSECTMRAHATADPRLTSTSTTPAVGGARPARPTAEGARPSPRAAARARGAGAGE